MVERTPVPLLARVTWRSALQVVLLVIAFAVLWRAFSDLDLHLFWDELLDADWWLVVLGALVAQLPRFAQALSAMGASPTAIPYRRLYVLQLSQSYVGVAVPSSAARIALNVRFFQRQGLTSGSAVTVGAIDGFAGFIVQAIILAGLLLFTPRSIDIDLDVSAGAAFRVVLAVAVGVAVVFAVVSVLRPTWRELVALWIRGALTEGWASVRGLRSPRRLLFLFAGNLLSDVLFAIALGIFARGFGTRIGLGDLLVIVVSVALLAGLLPIPGGVGVTEGGLALGLTGVGMPEEAALAAVIAYRLFTFYLPPLWGFPAFRWLQREGHL